MHRTQSWQRILFCVLSLSAISSTTLLAQSAELAGFAAANGVRFGSPLIHRYAQDPLYEQELSYASIIVLWEDVHSESRYEYDFDRADSATEFARDNQWGMMGTALMWGDDRHIDDWVFEAGESQGQNVMYQHLNRVLARYRDDFDAWVVVNEAVEFDGTYRDCHWFRSMGKSYIAKAFQRAAREDPSATLLYNDYDMELQRAKFDQIKELISYVQNYGHGARIDGLGWQLHVDADDVLDPKFDLANRMQEISNLGLLNYVTELDIKIDSNTPEEWEKQREAYRKIVEIFLNNPTHGDSFQVWGLSDRYSWFNDAVNPPDSPRDTLVQWPCPFNEFDERKPAYWGAVQAFAAPENLTGEVRIKNLWTNTYLNQSAPRQAASVTLEANSYDWESQRWIFEKAAAGSYRLRCKWQGDDGTTPQHYLHNGGDFNDAPVQVRTYNNSSAKQWFFEQVYPNNNVYRIKNRWTGRYLHTGNDTNVVTYDNRPDWDTQLWTVEYIRK